MHAELALVDANTSGTRIYYAFDSSTRFDEERSTQIGHIFLRKVSNFKRRSVIAMGGSVFADVGREAGSPA
jgi:hypothetical protein